MPDFDKDLKPILRNIDQVAPTLDNPSLSGSYAFRRSADLAGKPGSALDDFFGSGPKVTEMAPTVSIKELQDNKRYGIYDPSVVDLEDQKAYGQSFTDKAVNGILKGTNLAASTIAGGFGMLYGAMKSPFTGRLADIWDNEAMRSLDAWNEKVDQEILPNYYTDAEKNSEWYSTDNWFKANFLFDKLIKNSGFAVGAMVSGNIANAGLLRLGSGLGELTAGEFAANAALAESNQAMKLYTPLLKNMSRAFSAGKNVEAAALLEGKVSSIADLAAKSSRLAEIAQETNTLFKINDLGRRAAIAAYSSAGEASFEALQTAKEYRNNLIAEYRKANGVDPTGDALQKINESSESVGKTSFLGNLALLGATEYVQLPKILGSTYSSSRQAANSLMGKIGETTLEEGMHVAAKPLTKFGKVYDKVTGVGRYVFDPKEASQEGLQYALQVGTQNYYNKAYQDKSANALVDGALYGLEKTVSSKEGMESILLGGITGGLMQAKANFMEGRATETNTQNFLNSINNAPTFRAAFIDRINSTNRAVVLQQQQQDAVVQNDKLEAKDLDADIMHNYLATRIKYGRFDMVADDIKELRREGAIEGGLAQLKEQGIANVNDTVESFLERVKTFEQTANYTNDLYKSIDLRYSGITNEDGTRKYSPELMDKMVYASAKIANYDLRIPQVNRNLTEYGIPTMDVLKGIIEDGKPSKEATKEALDQINKLDVTSDIKDELKTSLSDVMEMSLRRKLFMKEYDDMKANPSNYEVPAIEEEGEVPVATVKQTVAPEEGKRKKTISKDLEIGKEYSLTEPFKRDGNTLTLAPKLTVLSKTLGGEYEVQLPSGDISFLTPEQFKEYNVIEGDNTSEQLEQVFNDAIDTVLATPLFPETNIPEGMSRIEYVNSLDNKELIDAIEKEVDKRSKDLIEKLRKAQEEQEELERNVRLSKEITDSLDTSGELAEDTDAYEAESKKADVYVMTGTISAPEIVGSDRAEEFGFNLDGLPNRDKIRGVYITHKNEDKLIPGLTDYLKEQGGEFAKNVDPKQTIAFVMVQQEADGSIQLVDREGKVIPEGVNKLENAIFQVKPGPGLKWSKAYKKDGGTSMFRSSTPLEVQEFLIKQYDNWRADKLSSTEIKTTPIDASFGIPEKVQTTDANGNSVDVEDGRTSVIDAGLVSQDDLLDDPLIVIPTTNDTLVGGTTSYKNPIAKAFLKVGNNYVKLRNRKLLSKEVDLLYKVINKLSQNAKKDGNINSEESKRLVKYLKSVVYWGTPRTVEGETKPAGNNSVWFDNGMLYISNKGARFPFTPQSMINNETAIKQALNTIYNNVNLSMVKKAELWNEEYSEITDITDAGEIKSKRWPNYQSFLLSGEGREGSAIPVSVNMKEGKNRKGIYFIDKAEADEFAAPVVAPKASPKPITPGGPKKTAPAETPINLTGKAPNSVTIPNIGTIDFTLNAVANQADPTAGFAFVANSDNNDLAVQSLMAARGIDENAAKGILAGSILAKYKPQIDAYVAEEETELEFTIPDIYDTEVTSDDNSKMNDQMADEADDEVLRAIVAEQAKKFQGENWKAVEAWLSANFPNLPVYRVKNIITATNGMQAWGMLKDGAIYLYENAEVGTVYHEVFEGVWKMFTTPEERKNIIDEFKSRSGTFVDRPTGRDVKYSEATDTEAKEQLAEEFRDHVLNPKAKGKKSFIGQLFSDLVDFIKSFFVGDKAKSNTEELFNKIGTGYYKQYAPYHSSLSFAKKGIVDIEEAYASGDSEFSIANFTGAEQHDLIQQMTYVTLRDLIKNNESLFTVNSINKKDLYNKLKNDLQKTVLKSKKEALANIEAGIISKEEAAPIISKSTAMWKALEDENNWNEIVKKHAIRLKSYSLEFDENDDLIRNEEDKTKQINDDATKINTFKKANPAVKLLLSTIPYVDKDPNNGKLKIIYSSINGATLIPASQAFMAIMNRVSSSRNLDEMMENLRKLASSDINYQTLYTRLTKNSDLGQPADLSKLNNIHDIQLLTSFWRSFKKQSPDVKNVYVLENGEVVVGDSNFTTAARQTADEFLNNIRKVVQAKNNPYFSYNAKDRVYEGKKGSTKSITFDVDSKTQQIARMTAFLKQLGIDFDSKDILSDKISSSERDTFVEATIGLRDSIGAGKKIFKMSSGKGGLDITGRLRQLGEIKAKLDNPEFGSTYFNVNGERTQTFIGTNPGSDLYDMLSQISNKSELRNTQYEYLLDDVFSANSVIMQKMFNSKGERINSMSNLMKVGYADGLVNVAAGKQKQSSKLTYKERISQELNLNLAGYYLNLVPGDASMEWMFYMGNPITADALLDGYDKVYDIFRGYFIDEMNLARENRPVAKGRVSTDLRFMKAILGDKLHDGLISEEGTPEEIYKNNKEEIDAAVLKFITEKSGNFNRVLSDYGIISKNEQGNYNVDGVALSKTNSVTEEELARQMNALNASYIINNIEMHKVLYSDPYQYSDELKRIKNFASPRQAVINSSPSLNKAMNRVWNRGFNKGEIGHTDFIKDFFRTITFADVNVISILKDYGIFEETDGGGIITMKANRNFRIRAGEWNENEERQYKFDVAYEKNKKDIPLSEEESDIFEAGNPQVTSAYTPLKPIVAGNKANDKKYNDVMLDKFALYPLSFRIMHELDPNSNAIKMYNKMQDENIDYAVYASGRKVGAQVKHELYNEDGSFNTEPFDKEGIINVPFSIMSIQSEVPSKDEALITRGSQTTKLITMDFMQAGVPVDFMPNEADFAKRYKEWNSSTNDKMKSTLYKEIKTNQDLLEQIMENGYNSLLKKLGIIKVNGKFEADFSKVADALRSEVFKREVNDNILDALEGFDKGDAILEATPAYQQIRNILYSIADKNVISPKISGGMKVQIPSTLLESVRPGKQDGAYTSDVLGFYEEGGKRVAEIMVGRWFDTEMSDEELLTYLNTTPEGQKILSGLAFRIPTQKQNSIDAFVIKKFLPKEFGDSVVIPSALVKKVGSDFDIDKLNIYFKNVYTDRNGDPQLIEYKGSEKATREFYANVFDQLSTAEQEYIKKQLARLSSEDEVDFDAEEKLIGQQQKLVAKKDKFVDNMYRKSLENAYIESSENLVKSDYNFEQLVKPNSADQLKNLSGIITKKLRSETFDYTAVGNMLSRSFMTRLRHAFVRGKYAIGIAAVSQTNHSLNQRQPIYIDKSRMNNLPLSDKEWLGDGEIKFERYNKILIDGKVYPTLSMIKNASEKPQNISDILGQFIDGYVDISKGPWIMELGATPNVASTWMFLVKLGVPVTTVAYFMNQPIVRDYLRAIENSGYSWLFIDDIVDSTKDNYKASKDLLSKVSKIPTNTELSETVGKKNLTTLENAKQQFILDEFLKYAKMAEQLFNVTQGSNFDTSNFNDPYLVFKKQEQLKKAQNSIITSVNNLLENSFIGKLNTTINDVREALAQVLYSDKTNVRAVIEKTLEPYVGLPDRDFVKVAQKAVADLFDWAVQIDRRINTNLANILVNTEDNVSSARKILAFKEEVMGNDEHPLYNNHVIKLIDAKLSDVEGGVDNISIKNKDNKVYDQNQIIYAFKEIKEYLNGTDNNLYGALVRLAVIQSGLSNSPISFTSLLPYEDFKDVYNKTLSNIEEMSNLNDYQKLNVFQRNNWSNDDIVPYRRAKRTEKGDYNNNMKFASKVNTAVVQGKIPKLLKLDARAREAGKDVIVYYWQDQNLTPAEQKLRDEKKARGDYSYINKGLFQKVYIDDNRTEPLIVKGYFNNPQYIYKMVNAWGDSYKANEFYATSRPSALLENGFVRVEETVEETKFGREYTSNEVSDQDITPFFLQKQAEKEEAETQPVETTDNWQEEENTCTNPIG